jgi:hypothetical protein
MAAQHVLSKEWMHRYNANNTALEALHSFAKVYLLHDHNFTWFAGYSEYASTNNALECANRIFKDRETFRRRLPVRDFFLVAENALQKWCINPDFQVF